MAADRAVTVAKSMVHEGTAIVNAMKVAPAQQVMLKVRFIEVARQASRELGVNWFGANNAGNRGFCTGLGAPQPLGRPAVNGVDPSGNSVTSSGLPIFAAAGTLLSGSQPFGVALANLATKGGNLDIVLSALETKGLIRRLAEPDLVALSGDTAAFIAGGEFPVPVAQPGSSAACRSSRRLQAVRRTVDVPADGLGQRHHQSAPGAVGERTRLREAIQISGFTVPSLTKREARTTVELRDGQSFAIAGLLSAITRRNISTASLDRIGAGSRRAVQ